MPDAIVMEKVRKTFGEKVAVSGIDLVVPKGGLYGFIGPNGAGKTTTIRMIMSIIFPDSGTLEVLGRKSAVESKDRIGYLPEERGVYKKMKVWDFLAHMGKLKGLDSSTIRQRIPEWLTRVQLPEVASKKCEELSKGMQQKVQFIASVIHEPDLLILDEPFSGLDPVNMRLLRDLINEEHDRGATVIFSTHVMQNAEQICDHIIMIHNGEKVLDEPIGSIRGGQTPTAMLVELEPGASMNGELDRLTGVQSVRFDEGEYEVGFAPDTDPRSLMAEIVRTVPAVRVELQRPSLEDVFVGIVTGEKGGDAEKLRASLRSGDKPGADEDGGAA